MEDHIQLGLSICQYVCLYISLSQGILVDIFIDSPILDQSYEFIFYSAPVEPSGSS